MVNERQAVALPKAVANLVIPSKLGRSSAIQSLRRTACS